MAKKPAAKQTKKVAPKPAKKAPAKKAPAKKAPAKKAAAPKKAKYVYFFGRGKAEGDREYQGQADEAHVGDDRLNRLVDKRSNEAPCVSRLKHHHPGVGAECLVELIAANINGIDLGHASLEQHVGEAPGRCAEVESHPPIG